MGLSDTVLWNIERNLTADLTLESLAAACGVSRYHLCHAFAQATGESVMRYIRARRLSVAAERLAREHPPVLELAFDMGYGSHEAFTRAFKDQFGTTPEQVKRSGDLEGLKLIAPRKPSDSSDTDLNSPRREHADNLLFIGLVEPQRFGNAAQIAGQWNRFMPRFHEIEAVAERIPYGIAWPTEDGLEFEYMTAAKVAPAAKRSPPGFTRSEVAAQDYLVFLHAGHASQIPGTISAIWNDWFPANGIAPADAPSLERHCSSFDPETGKGGVEIWVPVAKE